MGIRKGIRKGAGAHCDAAGITGPRRGVCSRCYQYYSAADANAHNDDKLNNMYDFHSVVLIPFNLCKLALGLQLGCDQYTADAGRTRFVK
jgi:hypothetical protein